MVQSFRRSGMGVLYLGVDVGAGDAEVDVIYTRYIIPRERPTHRVLVDKWTTTRQQLNNRVQYKIC